VVPVTGQDPVLDASQVERETHVRAPVVERENAAAVMDDEDRAMDAVQNESALRPQLFQAARKRKARVRHIYERISRSPLFRAA
jgi:hypothetical protein